MAFALAGSVVVARPLLTTSSAQPQHAPEPVTAHTQPAVAAPVATKTATAAPPTFSVSPEMAQRLQPPPETPDDAYIGRLTQAGIIVTNRDKTINAAHYVCRMFAQGNTDSNLAPMISQGNPGLSDANAETFISASVETYCPQYAGQLGKY